MKHADDNIINNLIYSYKNTDDFIEQYRIITELKRVIQKRTDFDINKAYSHIPVIIKGISFLLDLIDKGEIEKSKILADSMHNYPDFIIGNTYSRGHQFYKEELCFYTRECGESVFNEFEYLFED